MIYSAPCSIWSLPLDEFKISSRQFKQLDYKLNIWIGTYQCDSKQYKEPTELTVQNRGTRAVSSHWFVVTRFTRTPACNRLLLLILLIVQIVPKLSSVWDGNTQYFWRVCSKWRELGQKKFATSYMNMTKQPQWSNSKFILSLRYHTSVVGDHNQPNVTAESIRTLYNQACYDFMHL
jgi:hypothetical protein